MKVSKSPLIVSIFLIGIMSFAQSGADEQAISFSLIDADKNEVITIREMIEFYEGKTDENGELIDAKKLFYGIDANKNSIITLSEYVKGVDWKLANEFVDLWSEKTENIDNDKIENDLKEKFSQIDFDRNDELSLSELANFYKNKISNTTGNPVDGKLNFYAYDFDSDGKVTLPEFLKKPNWKVAAERLKSVEEKDEQEEKEQKELKEINEYEVDVSSFESQLSSLEDDSSSDDYLNERISMFAKADKDDDYKISLDELKTFYKGKKNKSGNDINAELRFYGLDKNDDGSVNIVEFTTKINWEEANKKYMTKRL